MIEMERVHVDDTKRTRLLKEVIRSQDRTGSFSGHSRRASRMGNLAFGFGPTGRESVDSSYSHDEHGWHGSLRRSHAGDSSPTDLEALFKELIAKGGLDALPASAGLDSYCLRASRADRDIESHLTKSAERMKSLCKRLEAMEKTMGQADPSSSAARSSDDSLDIRIVARPEGKTSMREERTRQDATALKYVSTTCQWKELDDMEEIVRKADEDELPRTFQPKNRGALSPRRIHPYLFLLTDSSLLDHETFRQCIWGDSPCPVAMANMRAAGQAQASSTQQSQNLKKSRTYNQNSASVPNLFPRHASGSHRDPLGSHGR